MYSYYTRNTHTHTNRKKIESRKTEQAKLIKNTHTIHPETMRSVDEIMPYFIDWKPDDLFGFVKDTATQKMLSTAYKAISVCRLWDYMRKETESYQFSADSEVEKILSKIKELGYDGHSGFSFGYTMRQMQFIALYGLDIFRELYLNATQTCET